MSKLSQEWVIRQVDRMLAVATDKHPDTFLEDCLGDPYDIRGHWDDEILLDIDKTYSRRRHEDDSGNDDKEQVSGYCLPQYKTADGRAFIKVRACNFAPRTYFTILHELGHHLQNSDIELFCALRDLDDKADQKRAEEEACNMFASKALMPDSVIPELRTHRWNALAISHLYKRTKASRPAVARRVAGLLPPGAWVTFIDQYGRSKLRAFSDGHTEYDIEIMPAERLVLNAFDEYRKKAFRELRPGKYRDEMTVYIANLDKPRIPRTRPKHYTRISVAPSYMSDGDTCMFVMGGH